MKIDPAHAKELKTNELSRLMNEAYLFLQRHGMKMLAGLGVLLIVWLGYVIWSARASSRAAQGWEAFLAARAANSADQFKTVAETYSGTQVGIWASLEEGELRLQEGIQLYFENRAGGKEQLKLAEEAFDRVLDKSVAKIVKSDQLERAQFGKASCLETTSDGDLTKPLEAYEKFLNDYPNSPLAEYVKERTESLRGKSASDFYAFFSAQNPKPRDLTRPKDLDQNAGQSTGMPPGHGSVNVPNDASNIPDGLQFPDPFSMDEGNTPVPAKTGVRTGPVLKTPLPEKTAAEKTLPAEKTSPAKTAASSATPAKTAPMPPPAAKTVPSAEKTPAAKTPAAKTAVPAAKTN